STSSLQSISRRLTAVLAVLVLASGCTLWDRGGEPAAPATETATATATISITASVTTTPTPTSQPPTATPIAEEDLLRPSTQLAYFHTISEHGDSAEHLAEVAGIVILTYGDEASRDAMRA